MLASLFNFIDSDVCFFEMELTVMFSLLKKRSTDMEPYAQMVSAKSVEVYQASTIKGCSNIFTGYRDGADGVRAGLVVPLAGGGLCSCDVYAAGCTLKKSPIWPESLTTPASSEL
jgi:hypothetical protein